MAFYLSGDGGVVRKFSELKIFDYWVYPAWFWGCAKYFLDFFDTIIFQSLQMNITAEVRHLRYSQSSQNVSSNILWSRYLLDFAILDLCHNIFTFFRYPIIEGLRASNYPLTCSTTRWESLKTFSSRAPKSLASLRLVMRALYSASLLDVEKANRSGYSNTIYSGFVRMIPAPLIDMVVDPSTCKI